MAWNVQITGPAQKEFQKLPAKDQARVKHALLAMQQYPMEVMAWRDGLKGKCHPIRHAAFTKM